jgi:hypothetical protein
MKRFFAWLAGFAGGIGTYRALRRQPHAAAPALPPAPDPAAELKAKLAQARAAEEPAVDDADVETRRQSVHDRARSAIDEMKGSGGES